MNCLLYVCMVLLLSTTCLEAYGGDFLGSGEKSEQLVGDKFPLLATRTTRRNHGVVPEEYLLIIVMSINAGGFRLRKNTFLQEIAAKIHEEDVACYSKDSNQITPVEHREEVYCKYNITLKQGFQSNIKLPSFVTGKDLVRLFSSGPMRGFLQEYNVTKFFRKTNVRELTTSYQITDEVWFPVATVAACSFVVAVVLVVVVCCCRKSCCHDNNDSVSQLEAMKHGAYVCHTVKPIETMSPTMVQPEMKELYTIAGTPRKVQKWTGELKRPGLLQSRRGSQASLVLDLLPINQEPVVDFNHESPTEESLLRKTKSLSFQDLEIVKDNEKYLYIEFWDIPSNTIFRKDKQSIPNASLKNRYPDFIPNSKTAVRLKEINNDPQSTYINSNFIRGYNNLQNMYIATEGPLENTISAFWRMVWEYNCPIIVMISKLKEKNEDKCAEYWPCRKSKSQLTFGDITVTFDSEISRNDFKITKLYINHGEFLEESRLVTHYWFTSWPDHKVPKSSSEILSLAKEVRNARIVPSNQSTDNCPVIVHCSAGRGRTGCFIAMCHALEQVEAENRVDILSIVSSLRIDRGGMIQKDEQYIFLYRTIFEYWKELRSRSFFSQSPIPFDIEAAEEVQEGDVFK